MARLEFGLENFTVRSATFHEIEMVSIAIEAEVADVEFREVKNDDKNSKSSIGDKIKSIIAWFREKVKKIGQFIRDMYYKHKHNISNKYKGTTELFHNARSNVYKRLAAEGRSELIEQIKSITIDEYLEFTFNDLSDRLTTSNRFQVFLSIGQLLNVMFPLTECVEKFWTDVKSNKKDLKSYLDKIEEQNEEFDRVVKTVTTPKITVSVFKKAINDAYGMNGRKFDKMEGLIKKLENESAEVIEKYSAENEDSAHMVGVIAKYTANVLNLCGSVYNLVNTVYVYFDVGSDPEDAVLKCISTMLECYDKRSSK